jgi:hypothetical protein
LSPDDVAGDCALAICVVGATQIIVDDTDVFDDGFECTDDLCNQGVASNPVRDAGEPCDGPCDEQVCDGLGACVECTVDDHCVTLTPVTNADCEDAKCNASKCEYFYKPVNTPLNAGLQTAGDCQLRVCDGAVN